MADVPFRRLNNNPGRVRPQSNFSVPPPRTHASGSWTNENSGWEHVTFDDINDLPFQRQVQKKFSKSSLKLHGNSRSEYLEGFKRHQQVVKDAEKQHQSTNTQ
jgi:hypothetical protein